MRSPRRGARATAGRRTPTGRETALRMQTVRVRLPPPAPLLRAQGAVHAVPSRQCLRRLGVRTNRAKGTTMTITMFRGKVQDAHVDELEALLRKTFAAIEEAAPE